MSKKKIFLGPSYVEQVARDSARKKFFELNVGPTLKRSTTMIKTMIKSKQPKLIKAPILFYGVLIFNFSTFQQKCKQACRHPPTSPVRKIHLHFRRSVKQFISYLQIIFILLSVRFSSTLHTKTETRTDEI